MTKTTIELPDQLVRDAEEHAREHGSTLRELVERGLRHELRRSQEPTTYRWEPITAGRRGDAFPARPPHEYAYDGVLAYGEPEAP